MCIAARGSSSGIAARGRVSRVYLRSMDVRSSVPGKLESSIVFITARGRVSGMHENTIPARGRSGGRVIINTVSGRYARSTSPCRRPGQCVWYACEQYLGVSPPGAIYPVSPPGEGCPVWYTSSIAVPGTAQFVRYAREQEHQPGSYPEAA